MLNNTAVEGSYNFGGAAYSSESDMYIDNSTFINNNDKGKGSALYMSSKLGTIVIMGSNYVKNSGDGGSIWIHQIASLYMKLNLQRIL